MATPSINPVSDKTNPFCGMILPFDIEKREAYTHNPITGAALPQVNQGQLPEQVAQAFGPEMLRNVQLFQSMRPDQQGEISRIQQVHLQQLAEHRARMAAAQGRPLPHATPLPPGSSPGITSAATSAIKSNPNAQLAKSDHSFKYGDHEIKLTSAYTKPNAEGICYLRFVSPITWKGVEDLYTKMLDQHKLIPKGADKIYNVGFVNHPGGKVTFEVYFTHKGVVEHRSAVVSHEDHEKAQHLEQDYRPILDMRPLQPARNRHITLTPKDLKFFIPGSSELSATEEHPHALMVMQIAEEEARILKKDHSVRYVYPEKIGSYIREMQARDPRYNVYADLGQRKLTRASDFKLEAFSADTEDGEVRILHGVPLRSGRRTDDLARSQNAQVLATQYPLHFSVNAQLGKLDKDYAPSTALYDDALIHLIDKKGKSKDAVMLQRGFEIPNLSNELDILDKRFNLFSAVVNQAIRYGELKATFAGSKKDSITVKDSITDTAPTSPEELGEIEASVLVRMLAAILVNSNPNAPGPKINLNFEFPRGITLGSLDGQNLGEIVANLAQGITGMVQGANEARNPTDINDLINVFITRRDAPPPPVDAYESDSDVFYSGEE